VYARENPKAHGESRKRVLSRSRARCSRGGGINRTLVRSLSSFDRRRTKARSLWLSCALLSWRRTLPKLVRSLSLITVGEDRAVRLTRSQLYKLHSGGTYRRSCVLSHALRSEKTERCVSLTLVGATSTASVFAERSYVAV
jgi:hypothetical protein